MLVLLCAVAYLVRGTAIAQTPVLSEEYRSATCGLVFRYPSGWDQRRPPDNSADVIVESRVIPTSVARVGPVEDWPVTRISPANIAQAVTAQNCLNCLRDSLVWLERYTEGTRTVNYTIAANRFRESDGSVHDFYVLDFHLTDEGTARGLGPGGWILTTARFAIPRAEYSERQHQVRAMVASIQFTRPTTRCWS
jgi:hypothetical protein